MRLKFILITYLVFFFIFSVYKICEKTKKIIKSCCTNFYFKYKPNNEFFKPLVFWYLVLFIIRCYLCYIHIFF